ncbi:Bifunctional aspartokinase/homoserine dehydrogenase [Dissostichus eleginoides]|uniref:Bifunctional aspartokinase/homoserine dehydrogenase n=1 Tax=Dissostichus eleginoides TaxID=100907 RepID=A0AAD9CDF7_DISEL|nr:Bifunctional aspartokinase/homoserine dehydrogenase [Dissostichus eleginoides]
MEKIVLACLGTYLEPSGIFGVLVETECYGTDVIKTVISGSHYSRAHTAHSIIHEVLTSMMFEAFLSKFPERLTELDALQVNCQSKELTSEEWNTTKERADSIQAAFQDYLKERASLSQSFDYWKTYVSDLFPIIRDLTNSLRSGDWILYLSAIERATSLFFFFGRTNYCRWTPLFLQDCYQLKDKFPLLYDSYMNGGFVVNTTKKGSGVPFDQALEQCYNRPAKVSGGIIGVTRKKEAVALWGIIKHKKDQYVELLEMKGDVGGELSLHHAFNPSTATKIVMMVQDIEEYLQKVCSPLQDQVPTLTQKHRRPSAAADLPKKRKQTSRAPPSKHANLPPVATVAPSPQTSTAPLHHDAPVNIHNRSVEEFQRIYHGVVATHRY